MTTIKQFLDNHRVQKEAVTRETSHTAEQQNTVLDLATNAVASDALPETFRVSTQSLLKAREAKSEFLQQQPGVDAMTD